MDRAEYRVPGRSLKVTITVTNNNDYPVTLAEFETGGMRFLNAEVLEVVVPTEKVPPATSPMPSCKPEELQYEIKRAFTLLAEQLTHQEAKDYISSIIADEFHKACASPEPQVTDLALLNRILDELKRRREEINRLKKKPPLYVKEYGLEIILEKSRPESEGGPYLIKVPIGTVAKAVGIIWAGLYIGSHLDAKQIGKVLCLRLLKDLGEAAEKHCERHPEPPTTNSASQPKRYHSTKSSQPLGRTD